VAAVLLALGASLSFGLADFYGGLSSRRAALVAVMAGAQIAGLAVIAVVVAVRAAPFPGAGVVPWTVLAAFVGMAGLACLYRGLAVGAMSIVAPIAATAPVVPVVAAAALGELPGTGQAAGIALAVAGVALLSLHRSGPAQNLAASVTFGLLTAAGFGGFLVAMDAASEGGVQWALLLARTTSVAAFVAVYLARRPALAVGRSDVPVLLLIGVLIVAADAMFAVASTEGLLSVVAVLSSLYPVVTMALARIYLQERLVRIQKLGVVGTLSGAVVISVA
jgi:drug/metabolite transporter (DMT)-like permease